jgi:ATP-dependent DNA helicase RecG
LFISKIGDERLETFSTEDYLAINALFHNQKLPEHLRPYINRLHNMGIVEKIGNTKFILSRGIYDAVGQTGVHTRLVGLDRETNKELILKHLKKSGVKGAAFSEFQQVLPSQSRNQIQYFLKELNAEGKIESKGKTKGATWFLRKD